MRRNPFSASFELSLMKEAQARRHIGDDCCCFVLSRWERCRRARFVVVLQKASQFVLVIEPRLEMLAHCARRTITEAVIEAFIVSVVEALLLQRPFQVP